MTLDTSQTFTRAGARCNIRRTPDKSMAWRQRQNRP